jgi:ATP-dependent HslUV protease subunit HslV
VVGEGFHGTTVVAVRRSGRAAMGGDGQLTFGEKTIMKHRAKKVRRICEGKVLAGFAGSVADAVTLFERFEGKLQEHFGNLPRAAVALAREWRTDQALRRLEALLVVMDREHLLVVSGSGEVMEPDDDVVAIGSGGPYALAAARALLGHTELPAVDVVRESLRIAASICVFTNEELTVEEL